MRRTTTDPKTEKKGAKKKGQLTPAQKKLLDTQQISDKRARMVSQGKMTWNEARKQQRAQDSTKLVSGTRVGKMTSGSSQDTTTKRKYKKASYKRGNDGNIQAY